MMRRKLRRIQASVSRTTAIGRKRSWRLTQKVLSAFWFLMTFRWLRASGRNWRNLLAGLPALVVVVAVMAIALSAYTQSQNDLRARYLASAEVNSARGNHDFATLMFERAMELRNLDDPRLFQLAQSAYESGQIAKGNSIIQQLAPIDQPRHAQSHFWRAAQLIDSPQRSASDVINATKHLKHVLTLLPSNHNARAALATLYFETGQIKLAAAELPKAVKEHPELLLHYAKVLVLLGRNDEAIYQGELSLKWLAEQAKENPQEPIWFYRAADCQMFLENFEKSASILEQLIKAEPNERKYHFSLSNVYVKWAESIVGNSVADDQRRLQFLSRAMEVYPENSALFSSLMSILASRNEASDQLEAFLNQNIAEGKAMALSHLILGSSGFIDQTGTPSEFHLERALDLMPNGIVVANNMAWYLLMDADPPDPGRALKIIDPVVKEIDPSSAKGVLELVSVWDTRGTAHLQLGNYREAIADLEFAVNNGLSNVASTHEGLAEAYEKIGLSDLAKEHRRLAAELAE